MLMDMWATLIYAALFLFTLLYCLSKKGKRKQKQIERLPPGSMGWPGLGETLQLYSQDPNAFFAAKQKRYGDIFKTHILGCPCVMLAGPEAARFVLVTRAELFKPTYPKSKEKMIGPSALFFHQGNYHAQLRQLVKSSLSPASIQRLIPSIEATATSVMDSWGQGRVVNTFHEMKKFSFEAGVLSIFCQLDRKLRAELKRNYTMVDNGYNSFPTSIPGTSYQRALSARKRLNEILGNIIRERRGKGLMKGDLLGHLLSFKNDTGNTLTEEQIADNIIGVLFAAQDTTATVLTWILKFLHDDQKLLEAVREEQRAIYESNGGGKWPLTREQTRNMPLTYKVILESLRLASVISFTFREAVVDVEYEGYLIPKGWKVMPLFRNIHLNPEFFAEPQKFDPSRFESSPRPNTYMPFGNGVHACPGNELAKLEILILLHHLVIKYRWELVGSPSAIQYSPFPVPEHGLPAKFLGRTKRSESV